MSEITAKVEKGTLIITLPFDKKGARSASGKTMVVASTHGNVVTDVEVDGKPVTIGVNAYFKA